VVEKLSPYGPNEPLHERVRERYIGHGLHLRYLENPQIGLPAVEFEQRVVVAAEIVRERFLGRYRVIKEVADGGAINHAGMYADPDDSTGEMVHDDQHPVGLEDNRLATEEIGTPQTVLRVPEKGQPGRAARARLSVVVFGQHAADDVLIDIETEYKGDLLGDAPATESGIPSFHLNDRGDQLRRRPFRAWFSTALGRGQ
jgi:hypothetical protein